MAFVPLYLSFTEDKRLEHFQMFPYVLILARNGLRHVLGLKLLSARQLQRRPRKVQYLPFCCIF